MDYEEREKLLEAINKLSEAVQPIIDAINAYLQQISDICTELTKYNQDVEIEELFDD